MSKYIKRDIYKINCEFLFQASEGGNSSQTGTECVEPGEELPEVNIFHHENWNKANKGYLTTCSQFTDFLRWRVLLGLCATRLHTRWVLLWVCLHTTSWWHPSREVWRQVGDWPWNISVHCSRASISIIWATNNRLNEHLSAGCYHQQLPG